jgi:hypothetical protein
MDAGFGSSRVNMCLLKIRTVIPQEGMIFKTTVITRDCQVSSGVLSIHLAASDLRTSNQLLCKPVKSAWTVRVKSISKWLFTVLVENVDLQALGGDPRNLSCGAGRSTTKGKGCDIGYALAASSCEGANSVEACTVTALDAITAFAVPNPNCPSQSRRFFQVWLLFGLPRRADHSAYFGVAKV